MRQEKKDGSECPDPEMRNAYGRKKETMEAAGQTGS